ncbi:MAG: hypothetical protein HQL28_00400 [Candidatus Omnitrophica bacterium]|nr:hypothetical protein [Candidatus Omnitrophota bacterium]
MNFRLFMLIISLLMIVTFVVTCCVFDSKFADATIDYFAFFAGIFLIVEGAISIARSPGLYPKQFLRGFRVIIGVCVFTIHLLQFMRF